MHHLPSSGEAASEITGREVAEKLGPQSAGCVANDPPSRRAKASD